MTREEMREVAEQAAERALARFLLVLGVDAGDPKSLLELQADLNHSRRWRKSVEQVGRIGLRAAVTTLVTGLIAVIWIGLQLKLGIGGK